MKHLLIVKPHSAKLACGSAVDAYYPMSKKALRRDFDELVDVVLRAENSTCQHCIAAAHDLAQRAKPRSAEGLRNSGP